MADRRHTGISNRETPEEEQQERERIPQYFEEPPPATDAAGRVGDESPAEANDSQTSHKTGARSLAQKAQTARYLDRSMPQTRKIPGAFGEEPTDEPAPGREAAAATAGEEPDEDQNPAE
jgi:hypothetical protein